MGRLASTEPFASGLELHHLPGKVLSEEDLEAERWHEAAPEWPEPGMGGPHATSTQWADVCGQALVSASRMYERKLGRKGSEAMEAALGKEKTVGDRIAAVTLLVQESPMHRLDELRTLLSFAEKKGRRERAPAIDALKDLFVNDLLPGDRRLIAQSDRDYNCGKQQITKRHLAYAMFEGELKTIYREFLQVLEESGQDTLAHFKQKAVKVIAELLVAKPENEKELLSMLVNKLGDPERKVSSTAGYSLSELIEKHHPQMRLIVVREVERLITRQNVTRRTQYYAVCFLNQIPFTENDVELARKFVRIYMDLFTACLAADKRDEQAVKGSKKAKKNSRIRKGRYGKKAVAPKREGGIESKESRLMGAILNGVNRAYPYTKPEQDEAAYQGHYDSLFHVAHAQSLSSATQALAFLFQVSQSNSTQSDRFYRALYSRIYDIAETGEPKQAAFLNLLYKAMKADTSARRLKAVMKRLLQAGIHGSPAFAGASAMVVSETFKGRQLGILKSFVSLPEQDDEDEHFVDVDKDRTGVDESEQNDSGSDKDTIAEEDVKGKESGPKRTIADSKQHRDMERYDPWKRDPLYAGAECSSLWEMVSLSAHFHPSIATFAKTICVELKNLEYPGDPLKDFSMISFLDRFSYKKPKSRVANSLHGKRSSRYRDDPVANSEEFQQLIKVGKISEDSKFFARFFESNPDRVVRQAMAGEEESETPIRDPDADSEEEAFEQALHAEMERLGADGGFASDAVKKEYSDVDEMDEDELKAFHRAFADEMADSGGEDAQKDAADGASGDDDADEVDDVVPLEAFQDSDGESEGRYDEDQEAMEEHMQPKKKDRKRKRTQTSVFAAAEDFAEAIDEEAARARMDGKSSREQDGRQEEKVTGKLSRKRKMSQNGLPKTRKRKSRRR